MKYGVSRRPACVLHLSSAWFGKPCRSKRKGGIAGTHEGFGRWRRIGRTSACSLYRRYYSSCELPWCKCIKFDLCRNRGEIIENIGNFGKKLTNISRREEIVDLGTWWGAGWEAGIVGISEVRRPHHDARGWWWPHEIPLSVLWLECLCGGTPDSGRALKFFSIL